MFSWEITLNKIKPEEFCLYVSVCLWECVSNRRMFSSLLNQFVVQSVAPSLICVTYKQIPVFCAWMKQSCSHVHGASTHHLVISKPWMEQEWGNYLIDSPVSVLGRQIVMIRATAQPNVVCRETQLLQSLWHTWYGIDSGRHKHEAWVLLCVPNKNGVESMPNWRCAAQVLGHTHCCQFSTAKQCSQKNTHILQTHTRTQIFLFKITCSFLK